jgi:WhiB family redox-sensing transcriptional regulator
MYLDPKLASCVGEEPDMFFADDEESPNETLILLAKLVCAVCPLKELCLQKAIDEDLDGIWGGTTTRERRITANREMRGYVPIPRVVSEKAKQAASKSNLAKATATVERDMELLTEALQRFVDLDELTKDVIKLRIDNPGKSLADIAGMLSVSRDIVAGRIRRVKERITNG